MLGASRAASRPSGRRKVECQDMFEESIDDFISRWLRYAVAIQLFPHLEGSPLLECQAGAAIIQIFERTGPYLSLPGPAKAILNPMVAGLELVEGGQKELTVTGVSRVQGTGLIIDRETPMVVVDTGILLVIGVQQLSDDLGIGDWVAFEAIPPIHGFIVTEERGFSLRVDDDESL